MFQREKLNRKLHFLVNYSIRSESRQIFRTERLPPKALFFARAVRRQYPNLDDPQSVLRVGVIDKRGDSLKKNIGKTSHVLCFPFCTKHVKAISEGSLVIFAILSDVSINKLMI